jgi:hypothetical protein
MDADSFMPFAGLHICVGLDFVTEKLINNIFSLKIKN